MTTTPAPPRAARLRRTAVSHIIELLSDDFGRRRNGSGVLANQVLLDALDRGDHARCVVWPEHDPVGVLYLSPSGTLVPTGDPAAGAAFAESAERSSWRVLVGDEPASLAVLDGYPRKLFSRRPSARRQRFMMITRRPSSPPVPPPGYRRAVAADVGQLTELACRLHVEDLMGPPIARANRGAVRARMAEGVERGLTWVVESDGRVVAKFDVSLRSRRRGAQIAGVYVDHRSRGRGVATAAMATLTDQLLAEGLPGVTLHVRADNAPAIAAYACAGMVDAGPWTLALR